MEAFKMMCLGFIIGTVIAISVKTTVHKNEIMKKLESIHVQCFNKK